MKPSKIKKIQVRLTRVQHDHLPIKNRSKYIRRLITQDMSSEDTFLQFMGRVHY